MLENDTYEPVLDKYKSEGKIDKMFINQAFFGQTNAKRNNKLNKTSYNLHEQPMDEQMEILHLFSSEQHFAFDKDYNDKQKEKSRFTGGG